MYYLVGILYRYCFSVRLIIILYFSILVSSLKSFMHINYVKIPVKNNNI